MLLLECLPNKSVASEHTSYAQAYAAPTADELGHAASGRVKDRVKDHLGSNFSFSYVLSACSSLAVPPCHALL
eukprot:COSAG01_NODE_8261_length_2852_cov_6.151471_1_plen_73_part_00